MPCYVHVKPDKNYQEELRDIDRPTLEKNLEEEDRLIPEENWSSNYCDVVVAQINYPIFKHNTQDSIEQARGRSHEKDSSQIFILDDMQFGGGGFGRYLG